MRIDPILQDHDEELIRRALHLPAGVEIHPEALAAVARARRMWHAVESGAMPAHVVLAALLTISTKKLDSYLKKQLETAEA